MARRVSRIVVCGTGFGHLWIDTISKYPRKFELVAVVARGSARSIAVCKHYRIPLVKAPEIVKGHVDVAVVAIGGRQGEEVAREWLSMGIPVLLEHPVEPLFLSWVLRNRYSIPRFAINGHFSDLPTVREFIEICHRRACLLARYSSAILATPRTLYSCLDIVLSLLSASDVEELFLNRSWLRSKSKGSLQLGPLNLLFVVMPLNSTKDDAAGSIGGHVIEVCLGTKHIILAGPTGPIIKLGAYSPNSPTWALNSASKAASWSAYSTIFRPSALMSALDRILEPQPNGNQVIGLQRYWLVSKVWRKVLAECIPVFQIPEVSRSATNRKTAPTDP